MPRAANAESGTQSNSLSKLAIRRSAVLKESGGCAIVDMTNLAAGGRWSAVRRNCIGEKGSYRARHQIGSMAGCCPIAERQPTSARAYRDRSPVGSADTERRTSIAGTL